MSGLEKFLGRAVEGLPLREREKLAGLWIARELYSPERLPLRIIQAIGRNPGECIAQLKARGLDPGRFEFEAVAGLGCEVAHQEKK